MIGRRLDPTAFVAVLSPFVAYGVVTDPEPRMVASSGSVDAFERVILAVGVLGVIAGGIR